MIIVYAYLCGDILHEGHLLQLENAKAMGDKLIVGVLTDEAVMEKKDKPTISFAQRLKVVQAIGVVDAVVPQHEYSPVTNVKSLGVDILMENTSHTGNSYLKELDKLDVRVIMTSYYPGQSSTSIKNKIKGMDGMNIHNKCYCGAIATYFLVSDVYDPRIIICKKCLDLYVKTANYNFKEWKLIKHGN